MRVTMFDDSIFEMSCNEWEEAFRIKYGDEEQAVEEFKEAVARHWRNRPIPTKLGWDLPWADGSPDEGLASGSISTTLTWEGWRCTAQSALP